MRRRARGPAAALLVMALVLGACGAPDEDERELRGYLAATSVQPHAFVFTESSGDRWFKVEGEKEDDLRYRLTLFSTAGPVLEMAVVDDALAVRFPKSKLVDGLTFGHPGTEVALRSGRWVIDPAGAPMLAPPAGDEERRKPQDPLDVGLRILQYVLTVKAQAYTVKEFSLEDTEYKPRLDPWGYPSKEMGEKRYDLIRPWLPKREDQTLRSGQGINEGYFRKLSAFVRGERIYQVCEDVDVEGHEEFERLREKRIRNDFLESLRTQVTEGRTDPPVRVRWVYAGLSFPDSVSVALPARAVRSRLDGFLPALRVSLPKILSPGGPVPTECLRNPEGAA